MAAPAGPASSSGQNPRGNRENENDDDPIGDVLDEIQLQQMIEQIATLQNRVNRQRLKKENVTTSLRTGNERIGVFPSRGGSPRSPRVIKLGNTILAEPLKRGRYEEDGDTERGRSTKPERTGSEARSRSPMTPREQRIGSLTQPSPSRENVKGGRNPASCGSASSIGSQPASSIIVIDDWIDIKAKIKQEVEDEFRQIAFQENMQMQEQAIAAEKRAREEEAWTAQQTVIQLEANAEMREKQLLSSKSEVEEKAKRIIDEQVAKTENVIHEARAKLEAQQHETDKIRAEEKNAIIKAELEMRAMANNAALKEEANVQKVIAEAKLEFQKMSHADTDKSRRLAEAELEAKRKAELHASSMAARAAEMEAQRMAMELRLTEMNNVITRLSENQAKGTTKDSLPPTPENLVSPIKREEPIISAIEMLMNRIDSDRHSSLKREEALLKSIHELRMKVDISMMRSTERRDSRENAIKPKERKSDKSSSKPASTIEKIFKENRSSKARGSNDPDPDDEDDDEDESKDNKKKDQEDKDDWGNKKPRKPDDDEPSDDDGDDNGDDGEYDDEEGEPDDNVHKEMKAARSLLKALRTAGENKNRQKEADSIKLLSLPEPAQFRAWRYSARSNVVAASNNPEAAFKWIKEVEATGAKVEDFQNSGKFVTLDTKLASSLNAIARGELGRKLTLLSEREDREGRLAKGRQLLRVVYDHFKIDEFAGVLYELTDLMAVKIRNDNPSPKQLEWFMTTWESTLAGMKKEPTDDVLEALFLERVRDCQCIAQDIGVYDRAKEGEPERSYAFLVEAVTRFIERKRRKDNRKAVQLALTNATSGKAQPTVPAPKKKGKKKGDGKGKRRGRSPSYSRSPGRNGNRRTPRDSPSPGKGVCYKWKNHGKCSGKDDGSCKYSHPPGSRGSSESRSDSRGRGRSRGREGSRSRSDSPKRGNGKITCKFFKRGTCNKGSDCKFDHPETSNAAPAKNKKGNKKQDDKSRSNSPVPKNEKGNKGKEKDFQ